MNKIPTCEEDIRREDEANRNIKQNKDETFRRKGVAVKKRNKNNKKNAKTKTILTCEEETQLRPASTRLKVKEESARN